MLAAVCIFERLFVDTLGFQPEFNRQIAPCQGAVLCDGRCWAAAVMRFDVAAWDSATVLTGPSHSALGALLHLHLLGSSGSGTPGTPLPLLSSSFSVSFLCRVPRVPMVAAACWSDSVFFTHISSNITDPKGRLGPWHLCVTSI